MQKTQTRVLPPPTRVSNQQPTDRHRPLPERSEFFELFLLDLQRRKARVFFRRRQSRLARADEKNEQNHARTDGSMGSREHRRAGRAPLFLLREELLPLGVVYRDPGAPPVGVGGLQLEGVEPLGSVTRGRR